MSRRFLIGLVLLCALQAHADPPTVGPTTAVPSAGAHSDFNGTGIDPDGTAFKHQRVSTGSVPAGGGPVTLTWTTAFPNVFYVPICAVAINESTALTLSVHHVESKTAAAVVVRMNNEAAVGKTGTLICVAYRLL